MTPIRILIVDDSAFMRKALSLMLKKDAGFEVVGEATNGEEAVVKAGTLRPDVITMDLEMPKMDGFQAIAQIRKAGLLIPILVVSSIATDSAEPTLRALQLGAADYIPKPSSFVSLSISEIEQGLLAKIRAVSRKPSIPTQSTPSVPSVPSGRPRPPLAKTGKVKLVVIGSSTGGPQALTEILKAIPGNFTVPIVIAQHMPAVFTAALATSLSTLCPIGARAIQGGETLGGRPTVYLAKGQHNLLIQGTETNGKLTLTADRMGCFYLPSATLLFKSACEVFSPKNLLAVVLTGMGEDGKEGAMAIHQGGGRVLVQDEATSVVWGMPGAVAKVGAADEILPLNRMAQGIIAQVR